MASIILWTLVPFSLPVRLIATVVALALAWLLVQLRFLSHMTVALWLRLWGSLVPLFLGSLITLPFLPVIPLLFLLALLIFLIGVWAAYRFYPLVTDTRLHTSRFARIDEIERLLSPTPLHDGLTLGSVKQFFFFSSFVCVRPKNPNREVSHSLIIAPSGKGKTTMNEGEILALDTVSMIITDPKGELFADTAGYRAKLGPVFVLYQSAF